MSAASNTLAIFSTAPPLRAEMLVRVQRPPPRSVMRFSGRTDHFLKASLTFSPACLRSPFDSSARPSASRPASPVAWPAFLFILPLTSVTLLAALFSAPMRQSLPVGADLAARRGQHQTSTPARTPGL